MVLDFQIKMASEVNVDTLSAENKTALKNVEKEKLTDSEGFLHQNGSESAGGDSASSRVPYEQMTSKDYYFDSYAHFGIHEVTMRKK